MLKIIRRLVCVVAACAAATSLVPVGAANAQTPPINQWTRHCVSDNSDSYIGVGGGRLGTVFFTSRYFQATACEYRYKNYMQVGLSWKFLKIEKPAGLQGNSVMFFKVWDCSTNKVVMNGVKNFPYAGGRLYGTSGTAQTATFTVKSGHRYKAQITGLVNYRLNNVNWRLSQYPPKGVGAFSAFTGCYAT